MVSDPSISASPPPSRKVRQAELARILGVKRQSLNELIKRGKIAVQFDGLIDVDAARAAILEQLHPSSKTALAAAAAGAKPEAPDTTTPTDQLKPDGDGAAAGAMSYHVAKTLREAAEAQIARLKLKEMEGMVVKKADVDRAAFEAARALRDGLTNCSKRIGATVAVLTTPDECAAAIAAEHRTLLQSWARTMGASTPPPEGTP